MKAALLIFGAFALGTVYLVYRVIYYPSSDKHKCELWLEQVQSTDNYPPTRMSREIAAATPACPDKLAIPALMGILDHSGGAAKALGARNYRPAADHMLTRLRNGTPESGLEYFDDTVKTELLEMMVNPREPHRDLAGRALSRFASTRVAKDLVEIIKDRKYGLDTSNIAASALAEGDREDPTILAFSEYLTTGNDCSMIRRSLPYFIRWTPDSVQFQVLDRCSDKDLREPVLSSLLNGGTDTSSRAQRWANAHGFLVIP